ncbi:DUF6396 domain-containing protein [Limnohabitans sp. DM1]|uniref:SEL1-like repeat protein n=1 Tax=Limnohabitans sp. DM1 TaxID=1597955 RepID=UPI000AF67AEF|nr:DUF6396 domain-containing protein [Limnohabitans sp. DM1]
MTAPRRLHPAIVPVVFFASVFLILFAVYRLMLPTAYAQPFTAQSDLALLAEKDVLPRNIHLKAFDPHRDAEGFTCRMQAEHAPKLTPAAQALHEEALQLSSPALWPNERNWPRSMQLWQQAAAQGHWKAALMLLQVARSGQGINSEKGQFKVPAPEPEIVLKGMEALMRQGVADAFFWMGVFWDEGYGLPRIDTSRAWAMWELAADLGSPLAQTRLAKVMGFAEREQEKPNVAEWANMPLMFQLLECAHAQGHGEASHLLGLKLDVAADSSRRLPRFKTPEEQYRYALQVLHDGVKFGSEDAAGYLFSSFDQGAPLVGSAFIDKARAKRYIEFTKALYNNPDLRFPNLDRVLPLPPAKLPHWNMADVDGLIRAAQAVRVTPKLPRQPAANEPGRAHIPEGHSLVIPADRSQWAEKPIMGYKDILSAPGVRTGLSMAAFEGYYQPLHIWATHPQSRPAGGIPPGEYESLRMRAMAGVPPLHYRAGEPLDLRTADAWNMNHYFAQEGDHRLVYWRYVGRAQAVTPLQDHLASAGLVQAIAQATDTRCADGQSCPTSGIWQPEVTNTEHPLAQVFNGTLAGESWRRQAFVPSGQNLPQFAVQLAPVLAEGEGAQLQVKWRLMVACEAGFEKIA